MYKSVTEFIDAKNFSFIILNLLIFIFIQILFFYYVASDQYANVVVDLSVLPVTYLERRPIERELFCAESDPNLPINKQNRNEALNIQEENDKLNLTRIESFFGPIILGLLGALIILFIIMFKKREKFIKSDRVIFFTIFAAFGTELFYYFFIIKNIIFIGEQQLISEIVAPGTTFEYSSPLKGLYK